MVISACEAGLQVLTEKPVATIPRDAAEMNRVARERGVRFGIVHNYLFFPETLRVPELIRDDEIGPIEVAILNWLSVIDTPGNSSYRPTWRHDARQAGGGILTDMLHIVYLAAEAYTARVASRMWRPCSPVATDQRPFEDPANRAWVFRTLGRGHGREFWSVFIAALREAGYDDVLSIENEDVAQPSVEGVEEAAAFILPLIRA